MIVCKDCKSSDVAEFIMVYANDETQLHHKADKINNEYWCPNCNGDSIMYIDEGSE